MSNLLNAMKEKLIHLKQNVMLRTVLICVLALLLIFSVTFAWYINNLGMWGMEFNTGNIDFNVYLYSEDGTKLAGPVAPDDEDLGQYLNAPLATIHDAQVGSLATVYIGIESCGSIGIDYRIAFDITGKSEKATAYLGGYKYNVTKVTDKVVLNPNGNVNVSKCERPERINDEIVTIDRNAINGTIAKKNGYDVYRFDYTLVNKNEEYTGSSINIFLNVFATQVGGDFDDTEERGHIYYCSSKEDIDRAKVEAYPGDIVKLTSDIVYYGDLVFNKPVNLETNDFTLTVNGNLMYDYVLGNSLKLDAGGLGRIVVQCTKEGVGGNLKIKAPLSDVTLTGSNASIGDIVVEKTISVDATNSYGSAGVSFNNIRIVDEKNSRKSILLQSNTRATVSFGTTIGLFQSDVKANNIEIVNNGVIGDINLSNMELLEQTNSPQIYILNNHIINNPIALPNWSVKFVESSDGTCTGNTRIIQSFSGNEMTVVGTCPFKNRDIEVELKDSLVEQIEEGNDSRLKIYYRDIDGQVTTIKSILENYLKNETDTGCQLSEIIQLEIISVGDKAINNDDLAFLNGKETLSLRYLDMNRANITDTSGGLAVKHRLPDYAFRGMDKYENLVLPQNLLAIGNHAFSDTAFNNYITIPSGVTEFGTSWFLRAKYVRFAASVPPNTAYDGMSNLNAIFVDEPYIDLYKSTYSKFNTRIYPASVMDETKDHFVRNIGKDEWEITYLIRGNDPIIGDDITIDGQILNITSVYDNAYRHNYSNTSVVFDDSVLHVGDGNFTGNLNIVSVDLNNVKTLGTDVFSKCSKLSSVNFGNQLESIGSKAFESSQSLNQELNLPSTMKSIGSYAFRSSAISKVNTGGTMSVDGGAFANCSKLVVAELPNVTVACETDVSGVFNTCSSLVSVSMPALEKSSGTKMFESCKSLRELYLSADNDDISIGSTPFVSCNTKKIKIFVPEELLEFYQTKRPSGIIAQNVYPVGEKMGENLVNGFNIGEYIVLKNSDNSYSLVTSNLSHTGKYSIPTTYNGSAITKIYTNCFRNQDFSEVTLTLGNNLKEIGDYAFYALTGLKELRVGTNLEVVGNNAFADCANISQDLVLPATMKTIGNQAFFNTAITSVKTGGTTSIGGQAFAGCLYMVYAELPNVNTVTAGALFERCNSLVSVDMPKLSSVSGNGMFSYCTSLREIYLGSRTSGLTLGTGTFINMSTAQVKMYVPEDLLSLYSDGKILNAKQVYPRGEKVGTKTYNGFLIGDYIVLRNDDGYALVTSNLDYKNSATILEAYKGLPITKIYQNAFRNQKFTDVDLILGDDVKVIGANAFDSVTGLRSVTMDGVTTVESEAFKGSSIELLNGPSITDIQGYAFSGCSKLQNVKLPVIVDLTGDRAFYACSRLKTVYFEDVMSVNTYAFSSCTALEKVTINRLINDAGTNMPNTMRFEKAAPCKIYVPYRSLSAYPAVWSEKNVVSFDIAVSHNRDTYVLSDSGNGRYLLIDFIPSNANTSMTLPNSLSYNGSNIAIYGIKSEAFISVSGAMKNITLPSTVALIDEAAFIECAVLENIYVNADNRYFTSVNGVLYSKDGKMLVKYPTGRTGKFDMSVSAYGSTIGIGGGAFANAQKLTEIVFPSGLKVIDSGAFTDCTKLQTVEFTGNTPPVLMGSGIFDVSITNFQIIIPNTSSSVVNAYLCAYNFGEYEPYIDLGGNAAPGSTTNRNNVNLG